TILGRDAGRLRRRPGVRHRHIDRQRLTGDPNDKGPPDRTTLAAVVLPDRIELSTSPFILLPLSRPRYRGLQAGPSLRRNP
ncbi:MAG TPA: hypothetical protein VL154_01265, partial [Acetobacteraceae bacterium]|nr:hypothetical protein [Acetobacteraceae bacterium]